MHVVGDPAYYKCKDNGNNNAERFPTLGSVEAPHSHTYGHIRPHYGQHGDEEAHEELEVSEGQFIGRQGQCTNIEIFSAVNTSRMSIGYAAGQRSQPDANTYELSFPDGPVVLGPHHHPCAQAAIHTYGRQEEDAGKHVADGDDGAEFAHKPSERPVVVLGQGDD